MKLRKKARKTSTRSETVSVRLEPKLRYLAELAARKQRRTLSSFVEWAVENSLDRIYIDDNSTIGGMANSLWDVDDADRFVKLATRYEYLLNHDEQLVWKLIKENGYLWKGRRVNDEWTWTVDIDHIIFERLREYWDKFKLVARDEAPPEQLPTWGDGGDNPKPPPF